MCDLFHRADNDNRLTAFGRIDPMASVELYLAQATRMTDTTRVSATIFFWFGVEYHKNVSPYFDLKLIRFACKS